MSNSEYFKNKDFLISLGEDSLFIKQSDELKEQNKKELLNKIEQIKFEINRAKNILANERFVASAPAEKVQAEKDKLEKYTNDLKKYEEELKW
ncbi:valyl-tRNA synthetase, partial [Mycoplasmopsis edwardii]